MSIEGLGKRFQEARKARGLSLDETARLTKIRQSRLAEIEADDYSNFPSLAYAKGFLQIYGKFLNIDVSPYMDAFESSQHITVDGYSYLQDRVVPKPSRTPVVRSATQRASLWPFIVGLIVLFGGIWFIKLILNVQRITPHPAQTVGTASPSPAATVATVTSAPAQTAVSTPAPSPLPSATPVPTAIALGTPMPKPSSPEVRRAEPVRPEDLEAAAASNDESTGVLNRIDIKPLRRTYVQVTVDDETTQPAFERWVSPSDGVVEFKGHRFNVRVLDREAVQIRKNGRLVSANDADVTVE
jgi:cytoskeleton protein RodZ